MFERSLKIVAFMFVSLLLLALVMLCGCQSARPTYELKAVQEGAVIRTEFILKGTL